MSLTTTARFLAAATLLTLTGSVQLASAKETGCPGGGFAILANVQNGSIAASTLGAGFSVRGKYVEFDVDAATLGIRDYALTGAASTASLTDGNRVVLFSAKTPDLRGLALTSAVSISTVEGNLVIQRTGPGISMKIQAQDCPTGGIFQMEPARADGTATDITHILGDQVFYFNNPNFGVNAPALPLCPASGPFTPACTPVPITPRVNFASDFLSKLVSRDSPQVATKIKQTGGTSIWRVSAGGRMGGVLGGDSVEVAPPAVACTSHCQAQDQVRGQYPVLGFPFPVPVESRFPTR